MQVANGNMTRSTLPSAKRIVICKAGGTVVMICLIITGVEAQISATHIIITMPWKL